MNDFSTILFKLILGNPLSLESRERRKSGTTSPDRVVSICTSNNLNHVLLWAHGIEFFLKSIWKTLVKSGTSRKNDVTVEIFSNIKITFLCSTEAHSVHTWSFISLLDKTWVEKSLWCHESRSININGLTIRELICLLYFT